MEGLAQLGVSAGITAGFHPISYAKVLIQLGYEPLPPVQTTSIFGRKVLCYPNVFKYLGQIRKQDGFFGMYRGLGARIVGGSVGTYVTGYVSTALRGDKPKYKSPGPEDEVDGDEDSLLALKNMCYETTIETIARCSGTIVSQPFHVIMIRCMAQFIGGDEEYNGFVSCIRETYNNDGILGFFAGLIPRLLGDIITIWLANSMAFILNNYVISRTQRASDIKNYTGAICSLMVTQFTYPLNLVSNLMAANNSVTAGRPPYMPLYNNWRDCWDQLSKENNLKRGSSLFFRYYKGSTVTLHDGTLIATEKPWQS